MVYITCSTEDTYIIGITIDAVSRTRHTLVSLLTYILNSGVYNYTRIVDKSSEMGEVIRTETQTLNLTHGVSVVEISRITSKTCLHVASSTVVILVTATQAVRSS